MTIQTTGSQRAGGRLLLPMLMACGFFGSATFTSVAPFLAEMSADLGVDEGVIGQLATASSLAAASALCVWLLADPLPALLFLDASLTRPGLVAGGLAGGAAIEQGAAYGMWSVLVVGMAVVLGGCWWGRHGCRAERRRWVQSQARGARTSLA
jgi:predicted MFS family arabinose efflux permease